MTIFGISIFDNLGFDFIRNFIFEIKIITSNFIEYLTNSSFYKYINKIFTGKEIIKDIDNRKIDYSFDRESKLGKSRDIF
jgi:hypothetical protein